jgi:hypothetical protein
MDNQNNENQLADLSVSEKQEHEIKGGMLDAGRVRISSSSSVAGDYFKKGDGDKISKPVNG